MPVRHGMVFWIYWVMNDLFYIIFQPCWVKKIGNCIKIVRNWVMNALAYMIFCNYVRRFVGGWGMHTKKLHNNPPNYATVRRFSPNKDRALCNKKRLLHDF